MSFRSKSLCFVLILGFSMSTLVYALYEMSDLTPEAIDRCLFQYMPDKLFGDKNGQYIEIDDIKMYYEVYGSGEPLLLLHGGSAFIETWCAQITELSKHFTVIVPETRAHGRTSDSDKPLTYEQYALDYVEFLRKLNLNRVHIVGWSSGAVVGLELALKHPELIKKLILIGIFYDRHKGGTEILNNTLKNATADSWNGKWFYQILSPTPERWPIVFRKLKKLWTESPTYTADQMRGIQKEILIMNGRDEEWIRTQHALELHQLLKNSTFVSVPNTGHWLPTESPKAVNGQIINFLK